MLSRDAIRELKGEDAKEEEEILVVKAAAAKVNEAPVREGGIGSTGGITISRDAMRDISEGKFGTKTLLRVPWGPDSSVKEGGIGSTGGIMLSRDAIRELKGEDAKEEVAMPAQAEEEILKPPVTAAAPVQKKQPASTKAAEHKPRPKPASKPSPPPVYVDKPVTLGLAEPVLGGMEGAKSVFGFLQSRTVRLEREGFLFGDIFADAIIRQAGFTPLAETINGRVAQLAFPLVLANMASHGDALTQLAAHPLLALMLSGAVTLATLPPVFDAKTDDRRQAAVVRALVPAAIRDQLLDVYRSSPLQDVFTAKAELTNSRAAMLAMGVLVGFAALF